MKYVPLVLTGFLFMPHIVSSIRVDLSGRYSAVSPHIWSGDEPHYLIQINSLLHDGDLDLANNYAAARDGAADAGECCRYSPLEHHVTWYIDGQLVRWSDVFKSDGTHRAGPHGIHVPKEEYSQHPPGLALLVAPLLAPLPDRWIEPASLICSGLAVALALYWYCALVQPYAVSRWARFAATVVAFFGTPALAYGRTLFVEPYLLMCAVGSLCFYLRSSMPVVAGAFVGFGMTMKPTFVVFLLPMLVETLLRNRRGLSPFSMPGEQKGTVPLSAHGSWAPLVRLCLFPGMALALILALNQRQYGSIFRSSMPWDYSLGGIVDILVHKEHGLFLFTPAVIIALIATPTWIRLHRREALIVLGAAVTYFAVMAGWGQGGYCYATRYLLPIEPLLLIPLTALPSMRIWKNVAVRWACYAVCALSLVINTSGALAIGNSWSKLPLQWIVDGSIWHGDA